ncbi:MAG: hypothetical protein JNN30_08825 [Rhodanobacteraceae bacterium]|nr:hypothetical protein [Rhodanobacteraceae bacterium]
MSVALCKPGLFGLERVRYFPRQLITADDMSAEQEYLRQRDRRHNRFLHGWGVVCDLSVEPAPDAKHPWQVRVCPGYAMGPQGDEISVGAMVLFDLATGICDNDPCQPWPCPPPANPNSTVGGQQQRQPVYLAIRHAECDSKPVRVHPLGCGCDEMLCEYSRIRDDFELKLLCELPQSHVIAGAQDLAWAIKFKQWATNNDNRGPPPLPPCPQCPDDPWVVIARIHLPDKPTTPIVASQIDYVGRRLLYSTQALQMALLTLATA